MIYIYIHIYGVYQSIWISIPKGQGYGVTWNVFTLWNWFIRQLFIYPPVSLDMAGWEIHYNWYVNGKII